MTDPTLALTDPVLRGHLANHWMTAILAAREPHAKSARSTGFAPIAEAVMPLLTDAACPRTEILAMLLHMPQVDLRLVALLHPDTSRATIESVLAGQPTVRRDLFYALSQSRIEVPQAFLDLATPGELLLMLREHRSGLAPGALIDHTLRRLADPRGMTPAHAWQIVGLVLGRTLNARAPELLDALPPFTPECREGAREIGLVLTHSKLPDVVVARYLALGTRSADEALEALASNHTPVEQLSAAARAALLTHHDRDARLELQRRFTVPAATGAAPTPSAPAATETPRAAQGSAAAPNDVGTPAPGLLSRLGIGRRR